MTKKSKIILGTLGLLTLIGVSNSNSTPTQSGESVRTTTPSVQSATAAPINTPTLIPTIVPTLIPTDTPFPTAEPVMEYSAPANACAGATAQCGDGSCSYSAHRQGTCSHHGGVATWL